MEEAKHVNQAPECWVGAAVQQLDGYLAVRLAQVELQAVGRLCHNLERALRGEGGVTVTVGVGVGDEAELQLWRHKWPARARSRVAELAHVRQCTAAAQSPTWSTPRGNASQGSVVSHSLKSLWGRVSRSSSFSSVFSHLGSR